jgi:hypothetical protein
MLVISLILFGSVLVLPVVSLWALRWAGRHGQLVQTDKASLLPFDESEPVGVATDQILRRTSRS